MSEPSSPDSRERRPARWLDPRNDLVFKLLLTRPESHDVLVYVLNAVIRPSPPIRTARAIPGRFDADRPDAKEIVFDVRAVLENGSEVDVEMQCRRVRAIRERLVYYGVRPLSQQLQAGDGYEALRPSIVIAFLAYDELDDDLFHHRFRLADAELNTELTRLLEIHTIELRKLGHLDASEATRHDPLVVFARLLVAETAEDREEIAKEADAMSQAVKILNTLATDDEIRRVAEDREARIKLDEMYRRLDLREARDEGRAEGLAEERSKLLRNSIDALREGALSTEAVARLFGLEVAEIERLLAAAAPR